jgi:hypothetical protein
MKKTGSKMDTKMNYFIVKAVAAKRNRDYNAAIMSLLEVVKDENHKQFYRKTAFLLLGQCYILIEVYPGARCALECGLKLAEMEKDEHSIALYKTELTKLAEKEKRVLIDKITEKILPNGKAATV